MSDVIRADIFLWSVRLYKTRSNASDACKQKKILIDDIPVKPSRLFKEGDEIKIKHPPEYKLYKIKKILKRRVGAKLVSEYIEEITPAEILEKILLANEDTSIKRERGSGRPTKKDRRDLKQFFD